MKRFKAIVMVPHLHEIVATDAIAAAAEARQLAGIGNTHPSAVSATLHSVLFVEDVPADEDFGFENP